MNANSGMVKRSAKTVGAMLPIMAAIAGWLILARPWESPTERAYRVCGECGLSTTEIAWLIGVMYEHPKTRQELLEDFRVLFDDPDDLMWCEPCAEAVVDAAERDTRTTTTADDGDPCSRNALTARCVVYLGDGLLVRRVQPVSPATPSRRSSAVVDRRPGDTRRDGVGVLVVSLGSQAN